MRLSFSCKAPRRDTKVKARDGASIAVYFAAPQRAGKFATILLGLYGGKDQGIPQAAVDKLNAALKAVGKHKDSQIHVYPDAPHAFNADYRPS